MNRMRYESQDQKFLNSKKSVCLDQSSKVTIVNSDMPIDLHDSMAKEPRVQSHTKYAERRLNNRFDVKSPSEVASQDVLDIPPFLNFWETQKACRAKPAQESVIEHRYYSVMDLFLGTMYTEFEGRISKPNKSHDQNTEGYDESKNSCIIHPANWLLNFGLACGIRIDLTQSSSRGWKCNLQIFRAVPDDSPIFEYCTQGDIIALRTLLSNGSASIRDTDSAGRTAIHVSHRS